VADLDTVWRNRSDDQVSAALESLDDYNDDAQAIIRAEQLRRGLPPPIAPTQMRGDDVGDVARLHRVVLTLVAVQWGAVLYALFVHDQLSPVAAGLLTSVSVLVLLFSMVAIPIASYRLLKRLQVAPGLALLTCMPLLSLLVVLSFRYIAADWARRHRVSVSLLGPKPLPGR
jgi:hypothetical protein